MSRKTAAIENKTFTFDQFKDLVKKNFSGNSINFSQSSNSADATFRADNFQKFLLYFVERKKWHSSTEYPKL